MRDHVLYKIGNGKKTFAWHDYWCHMVPLSKIISAREIYEARFKNESKVSELMHKNSWVWPMEWSTKFPILMTIPFPVVNDESDDKAVWVTNMGKEVKFEIRSVWKDFCCNDPKVDWNDVVWFSKCIPKHAFVVWMAVQGRLLTQDRVAIWRPNEVFKCALCNECSESHNHLLFTCKFSKAIWTDLLLMINRDLSYCWDQIVVELSRMPSNSNIWSIVRRLVCSAAVYFVWQERNNRMFKNVKRDGHVLVQAIKETVRLKMMSFIVKDTQNVNDVENRWNVKIQRVKN